MISDDFCLSNTPEEKVLKIMTNNVIASINFEDH